MVLLHLGFRRGKAVPAVYLIRKLSRNIREVRKSKEIGQTGLIRMLDLYGTPITRECVVKIERGIQHIQVQQLKAIRDVLETNYDELLK